MVVRKGKKKRTHLAVPAGPGDGVGVFAVVPVNEASELLYDLSRVFVHPDQVIQASRVALVPDKPGRFVGVAKSEASGIVPGFHALVQGKALA